MHLLFRDRSKLLLNWSIEWIGWFIFNLVRCSILIYILNKWLYLCQNVYKNDKNYSLHPFHHLIWITEENFQRFVNISRPRNTNSWWFIRAIKVESMSHKNVITRVIVAATHQLARHFLFQIHFDLFQRFREIALQIIMIMLCRTAANKEYIFVCSQRVI